MPKSHRGPGREDDQRSAADVRHEQTEHAEYSELWARGNQAATEQFSAQPAPREGIHLIVERATGALRVAPRDNALTERLVTLIERSALPADRREIVAAKLKTDQATADEIAAAIAKRFGSDSEDLRSTLIDALQRAVLPLEEGARADPIVDLADAVAKAEPALPSEGVAGLLRDLVMIVVFGWDEDEEQAPPGDYAAEESGW